MKKFFEDMKKDMKFKSAGPGKKLTEEDVSGRPPVAQSSNQVKPRAGPNERAQRAAAAALARVEQQNRPRMHTSQEAIRNQVKKELEAEAAATAAGPKSVDAEVPVKDPACFSVSGVYFICPLTGESVKKSEIEKHIKEAILLRFSEDPLEASVMMVHTFNKDREKVKAAVDIISKYIDNICKNPTEEKYRKIKVSNRVYQEKVSVVEGSREYLQALGFESVILPIDGQEEMEEFLILLEVDEESLEKMKEKKEQLQNGEPVRAKLDRQPQAFRSSQNATRFELPPDFYKLRADEVKRELQAKSDIVEKNSMLRTKAMREKDEQRARWRYNYSLLRIRFPDGTILQGTFLAWEKVSALYQFVRDWLENGWQPFELLAPGSQKLKDDEDVALNECNLTPAALLTFSWDPTVQADVAAAGGKKASVLKPELLANIQSLS